MGFFRLSWNKRGEEIPDPKPLVVNPELNAPKSLHERVVEVLRSERWNQMMREQGMETFDEANDFNMDDEDDTDEFGNSIYEPDEDGNFHASRRQEIAGRMVQDIEMEERHHAALAKLNEHFSSQEKLQKEKPNGEKPVPKV